MDWPKIWDYFKTLPTVVKEEFGALALWAGLIAPTIVAVIKGQLTNPHILYLTAIYYLAVGFLATISRFNKLKTAQERMFSKCSHVIGTER